MIDEGGLTGLKSWFETYVACFRSDDRRIDRNIELKLLHTRNVCREIVDIAGSLDMSPRDMRLAEAVALLHDTGRFVQYARYGTFNDSRSENHALLGRAVLEEQRALEGVPAQTRALILDVIAYHNCAELPAGCDERTMMFLKLVRDADKIDIWRVVTAHYGEAAATRNPSIELDLPDDAGISEKIVADLLAGHIARTTDMRTLNDFKLLQMGWVFDLNFPRTAAIAAGRGYLEKIRDALPARDIVRKVYDRAKARLQAQSASPPRDTTAPTVD